MLSAEEKVRIAETILKECFWGDYSYSEQELIRIAEKGSWHEKKFLFGKIIYNALHTSFSLRLFSLPDLKKLYEGFKVSFNKDMVQRKLSLSKAILLGEYNEEILARYRWKR